MWRERVLYEDVREAEPEPPEEMKELLSAIAATVGADYDVAVSQIDPVKKRKIRVTGERLVKVIGYDVDERRRVRDRFDNPWEHERFTPWYPLVEAGMGREDCVALITDEGLPPAYKSSCTFCPSNSLSEWIELRDVEPEAFAQAIEMSRRAHPTLESPEVVGLMRCNPHGKRQLHVWADGGYPDIPKSLSRADDEGLDNMPCECAL